MSTPPTTDDHYYDGAYGNAVDPNAGEVHWMEEQFELGNDHDYYSTEIIDIKRWTWRAANLIATK